MGRAAISVTVHDSKRADQAGAPTFITDFNPDSSIHRINMRALSQGRSVSRIAARGSRTAVPRLTGRGLRAAAPRLGADDSKPDGPVHFRNTPTSHPLGVDKWVNPTINHVWSEAEVDQRLATQPRHTPVLISEKIAHG